MSFAGNFNAFINRRLSCFRCEKFFLNFFKDLNGIASLDFEFICRREKGNERKLFSQTVGMNRRSIYCLMLCRLRGASRSTAESNKVKIVPKFDRKKTFLSSCFTTFSRKTFFRNSNLSFSHRCLLEEADKVSSTNLCQNESFKFFSFRANSSSLFLLILILEINFVARAHNKKLLSPD